MNLFHEARYTFTQKEFCTQYYSMSGMSLDLYSVLVIMPGMSLDLYSALVIISGMSLHLYSVLQYVRYELTFVLSATVCQV